MKQVTISIEEWVKLVESGVYAPATVIPRGSSMWPLIRGGKDSLTVRPLEPGKDICEQLKVGDVIIFRRADGAYIVHRIWKMEKEMIQTYGDNCQQPDAPIAPEAVCGIVTGIHRGGKDIDPCSHAAEIIGKTNRSLAPIRRGLYSIKHGIKHSIKHSKKVIS